MKICIDCKLPKEVFYRGRNSCRDCCTLISGAYAKANPGKVAANHAAWSKRNPGRMKQIGRRSHLKKYGMDDHSFHCMLEKQGGLCAICLSVLGDDTKDIHIDHDHSCCPGVKSCGRCVRGLLCKDCNRGLGLFRDNPVSLENASRYILERKR